MAQGDGHRVGGVVRLGDGGEAQQLAGHLHDLALFGLSIAGHGLLDLGGAVLKNGDSLLLGGQEDHPSGLGHTDTGGHVLVEKELLHRHGVRPEGGQQLVHILEDLPKAPRERHPSRCRDGPAPEQTLGIPVGLQDAEAHDGKSRVDA